jgi:catechol 2,3-dioxygenase-like lactoylglutathione lyase family enzyme
MLALAIGLALINAVRRGGRAWVAGTAHVVSASEPPASSAYGRCELQLVVAAPGLQASAVKVRDPRVPVAKWPDAGATLPVTVAVDDMRHVRIQWDEVMTHSEAMEEPEVYADPLGDLPVDDLLPEPEAPPWVTRDRQQWNRPESEADPVTADLSGQLGDLREGPVVVREAPGGPIVLEGTLVDADARPSTQPRRPRPSPRPSPRPRPQPAEPSPESSPGDAASERAAGDDPDADPPGGTPPASAGAATTAASTPATATATTGADDPNRDDANPDPHHDANPDAHHDANPDAHHDADLGARDDAHLSARDDAGLGARDDAHLSARDDAGAAGPAYVTATAGAAGPEADADPEVDLALDEPDEPNATPGPDTRAATDRSDASGTVSDQTGSPWYGDRPVTSGIDIAPEPSADRGAPDSPDDSDAAQHLVKGGASEHSSGATTIPVDPGDAGHRAAPGVPTGPTEDPAPPSSVGAAPTDSTGHPPPEPVGDVTPEATRNVTPGDTGDVTPAAAHGDTPEASHGNTPEASHGNTPEASHGGAAAVAASAQQVRTFAQAADSGTARSGAREGRLAGVKAVGAKAAGAVAAMAKAAGAKAAGMTSTGIRATGGTEGTGSGAAGPSPAASAAPGPMGAESVAAEPVGGGPVGAGAVGARPVGAGSVAAGSVAAGSVAGEALIGAAGSAGSAKDEAAPTADRVQATEADADRIDEVLTAYPSARPGPAGAIHGVGITVLVTDLDRSTRFYRDMLGFFEIDSGDGSAVLASGDTRLVLRTVHELSPTTGRLIYLNLEVGDVDAVYEELRAKGVTFVHEPRAVNRGDRLEMWAASFSDPDGHNIAVTQWRGVS